RGHQQRGAVVRREHGLLESDAEEVAHALQHGGRLEHQVFVPHLEVALAQLPAGLPGGGDTARPVAAELVRRVAAITPAPSGEGEVDVAAVAHDVHEACSREATGQGGEVPDV